MKKILIQGGMAVVAMLLILCPGGICSQLAADEPLWLRGGHSGGVTAVAFSPNGFIFATASEDSTIKIRDTRSGLHYTLSHAPYQVNGLVFLPESDQLISGAYNGSLNIWRVEDGSLVRTISDAHWGKVTCLATSPDGKLVATAGSDWRIRIWTTGDWNATPRTFTNSSGAILSLNFSPNGSHLAAGGADRTLRLWRVNDWMLMSRPGHSSNITSVAFSPDSAWLASGSLDGSIRLWQGPDWTLRHIITNEVDGVTSVIFAGAMLVGGDSGGNLRIWPHIDSETNRTIQAHAGAVTSMAVSNLTGMPAGLLASGSADHTWKWWNPEWGVELLSGEELSGPLQAATISGDARYAGVAMPQGPIFLMNLLNGQMAQKINTCSNAVTCISFSPDGSVFAAAIGGLEPVIQLWIMSDGHLLNEIPAPAGGARAMAFSPDGGTLAFSGGGLDDPKVHICRIADGLVLHNLDNGREEARCLAFSHDGQWLASGGRMDTLIRLWQISGSSISAPRLLTGHARGVNAVAFSADDSLVASGGAEGSVILWRKTGLEPLKRLGGHTNQVHYVGFSPDGSTLLSGGNSQIKLWNVADGSLLRSYDWPTGPSSTVASSPNGNLILFTRQDAAAGLVRNPLPPGQPSAMLAMSPFSPEGLATIDASGPAGYAYFLEASTNLTEWIPVTSLRPANTHWQFTTSPGKPSPLWFYRAMTPP